MMSGLSDAVMLRLPLALRERIAQRILVVAVPAVFVTAVIAQATIVLLSPDRSPLPGVLGACGALVAGWQAWRGQACRGTISLIVTLLAAISVGIWLNGGVFAPVYTVCMPLAVLAAIVNGPLWALGFIGLTALLGLGAIYARSVGWIGLPPSLHPFVQWTAVTMFTGVTAVFVIIPINLMRQALHEREAKAAELALARDAEQARAREFLAVFNQAFQLMGLLDLEGRVVQANATALTMAGASAEHILGRSFAETPWWPEDQRGVLREAIARVAAGEHVRFQTFHRDRGGNLRNIDFSLSPFRDAAGKVTLLIAEGRDISDLVNAEARLRRAEKIATLGEFAAGVAHDFNNLLAVVLGYADLLRMRSEDPRIAECAERITDAAGHGRELTTGLLRFARHGATEPLGYDVHESVRQAVTLFRAARGRRDAQVVLSLDAPRSLVSGWPVLMQSTVLNLCLNARDAMPQGGTITVATAVDELDAAACAALKPYEVPPGPALRLSVADTGTGMTAEVLARCRELFFTTKGEHGTGLGLSSVHGTVSGHRGALRIESAPGRGTSCTMWLPLAT